MSIKNLEYKNTLQNNTSLAFIQKFIWSNSYLISDAKISKTEIKIRKNKGFERMSDNKNIITNDCR